MTSETKVNRGRKFSFYVGNRDNIAQALTRAGSLLVAEYGSLLDITGLLVLVQQ